MIIRELSREECLQVLAGSRLARLACAHENQPYVVPVYLAFDAASGCLYGFTTPGQKVEWMRANPLVCVEVDEIVAFDQWVSVIASGHYEELPENSVSAGARDVAPKRPRSVAEVTPVWSADSRLPVTDRKSSNAERERAWLILQNQPEWWEPACIAWTARAHRDSSEPFTAIYYRIRIDHITGHEATGDARDAIPAGATISSGGKWGWLGTRLRRMFGGITEKTSAAT